MAPARKVRGAIGELDGVSPAGTGTARMARLARRMGAGAPPTVAYQPGNQASATTA